jgi:hypothetical protein
MPEANWKAHERAVANFFGHERHKAHLLNDHRRLGTSPSDVVVSVDKWLEHIKQPKWPRVFDHIVIECKYTKDPESSRFTFGRYYLDACTAIPEKVDQNERYPVVTFGRGSDLWLAFRLGHFPKVYKGLLASERKPYDWLRQLLTRFWWIPHNAEAPNYLQKWEDQTKGWKREVLKRVLPCVCIGSSYRMRGEGGGKVVLMQLSPQLFNQ